MTTRTQQIIWTFCVEDVNPLSLHCIIPLIVTWIKRAVYTYNICTINAFTTVKYLPLDVNHTKSVNQSCKSITGSMQLFLLYLHCDFMNS